MRKDVQTNVLFQKENELCKNKFSDSSVSGAQRQSIADQMSAINNDRESTDIIVAEDIRRQMSLQKHQYLTTNSHSV